MAAAVLAAVLLAHGLALVSLVAAGGVPSPTRAGQAPAEAAAKVSVRALAAPAMATGAPPPAVTPTAAGAPAASPTTDTAADVLAQRPGSAAVQPPPADAAGAATTTPGATAAAAAGRSAAATRPPAATPSSAEPVDSGPADPAPAPIAVLQVAAAPAAATTLGPLQAGGPLPRYRAQLPPPFEARFDLRRGPFSGQAQWRYATEGSRYRLELQTLVLGQNLSHLRSEGGSSAAGLEPMRFVDGRRGRDRRAVNFQRDAPGGPRISFSGPGHELPLPEGVQDRLSWLLQLAAIVDAEPALRRPGARILMWVVSPRGEADVWTFEVSGAETLRGDDGRPQPALTLQRKADSNLDTEVRVWLDPAAHHLPLRAAWRHDGEGPVVELRRETLDWR